MSFATPLFDTTNNPSQPLLELLALMSVSHDGTLRGIRHATQAAWYESGKFRAQIQERHADKKIDALPYLDALGFIHEVEPLEGRNFEHGLVLGGTVTAVRRRLAFALMLMARGQHHNPTQLIIGSDPATSSLVIQHPSIAKQHAMLA